MPLEYFPNLSLYIIQNQQFLAPNILFALITTLSPDINTCEHLIQNFNPNSSSIPPKIQIHIIHSETQLMQDNHNLINSPLTLHKSIYEIIHQNLDPPNPQALKDKYPYLPKNFLKETLRIFITLRSNARGVSFEYPQIYLNKKGKACKARENK